VVDLAVIALVFVVLLLAAFLPTRPVTATA
jgi:hypothetical protein